MSMSDKWNNLWGTQLLHWVKILYFLKLVFWGKILSNIIEEEIKSRTYILVILHMVLWLIKLCNYSWKFYNFLNLWIARWNIKHHIMNKYISSFKGFNNTCHISTFYIFKGLLVISAWSPEVSKQLHITSCWIAINI